jgi:uncharacterized protein YgbK (DUF1537 family)
MPRLAVIADDLTGANATGILFGKRGFRAISSLGGAQCELPGDPDVIVVTAESRAIPPTEAYRRVYQAAKDLLGLGVQHFDKRIDSTLRGNMGAEIDALLQALREQGTDAMAVVVAAFPGSGRSTVGGYHLVGGVPLELTGVANDPTCPIRSSSLPYLLSAQSRNSVGVISLSTVLRGDQAVADALRVLYSDGNRVIAVDCVADTDLETIAHGAAQCGLPVVSADPGPFGAALAAALFPSPRPTSGRVLAVAGSVTAQTREQLKVMQSSIPCAFVHVNAEALARGGNLAAVEADRALESVTDAAPSTPVVCLHTVADAEDVLDIGALAAELGAAPASVACSIADGLARIAVASLAEMERSRVGVYGTGGDIIAALCRACGAQGIELIDEVLPLATYGRLVGGQYSGLPLVTKGGLVGGPDATLACVDHLINSLEERA